VSFPSPQRRPQLALLVLAALLAVPGSAAAASGPKLLAPAKNAVIPVNTQPTFVVRDRSSAARKYHIFLTISSVKKVKHGELQQDRKHGNFSSMKRKKGGKHTYKPILYTFPDYFLQRPGRYWWQTYHIDCVAGARSCHVLSKIRSFTVK
jgi:hypothetical protein